MKVSQKSVRERRSSQVSVRKYFVLLSQVAPASAAPLVNPGQTFGDFFSSGGEERSDWESLLSGQCEEGSAYCWMSCLTLPPGCSEEEAVCLNMMEEPCCTDTLTDGCLNMDGSCQWQCPDTQFI